MTKPLPADQGLAFPNPLSTNDIVWAFPYANPTLLWFDTNRVPTIGAVCGENLHVGTGGGEVNSLASRDSRGFLCLWRHAAVVPT